MESFISTRSKAGFQGVSGYVGECLLGSVTLSWLGREEERDRVADWSKDCTRYQPSRARRKDAPIRRISMIELGSFDSACS